jgi:hypothetical protein
MSFDCLPAVDWEGKKPKQIYVPEENAKPIREELLDMINNDDNDIRDWARSILEPFEICYISKTKEDTNFDNWEPINPWMCVDETEQIIYDRIFSTEIPRLSVIRKIVSSLQSHRSDKRRKWPSWLPIPLETDDKRQWMSDEKAKAVVIMQSSDHDNSLLSCDLSKAIFEQAKRSGLKLYNLVRGFEELLPPNRKIRDLSVEESGGSKIYQLSINHLRDSDNLQKIYDLLNKHGQTNTELWPIFVKDIEENFLMISEPGKGWNSTFFCLSDNYENKNKSLWSFDLTKKSFSPIGGESPERFTPNYITNLDNEILKYTHLVSFSDGGIEISEGYKFIIDHIKSEIKFSLNKYHFINSTKQGSNSGPKTWFSLGIYSHLPNTSVETKQLFDGSLPPLPNILHSLKMPREFTKSISPPEIRVNRGNLSARFSLQNEADDEGFARHIFNLSSDKIGKDPCLDNNYYKDSIRVNSHLETDIYNIQNKRYRQFDETDLESTWQKCQEKMEKNWSFIFRIYSPALAILEHMIINNSFDKKIQQLVFTLASLEGQFRERFSSLNKNSNRNFQIWFAYITDSPKRDGKQRLQIEIARNTSWSRAKGMRNQDIYLSDDIFSEYRNHIGFYTSESFKILDNELYKQGKENEQEDHITKFWSTSNNGDSQGGLIKLILNIKQGVELPISYGKTAKFQETLNTVGREHTNLKSVLQSNGIEFLFENPEVEENIFSWIFDPFSSSGDRIISKLTNFSDENPSISLFIEAIWNRLCENYSQYAPQLLEKLGDWCTGIDRESWKEYVSNEFYEKIIEASQGKKKESLLSKLVKCTSEDQTIRELKSLSSERCRCFISPSIWKNGKFALNRDILFVTNRKSLFGEYYPSEEMDVVSTGYGLSMNVQWYPLSPEEWTLYNNSPILNDNKDLKDKIVQHWVQIFDKCYAKTVELSKNTSDLMQHNEKEEFVKEVEERHLFLANRVAWLILGMYTKKNESGRSNKNYLINSLPQVEIISKSGEKHINSKINEYVTLGPSGWDLDYDSETHRLLFITSKPISKELMENKIKRLKEILKEVTLILGGKIWDNDDRLMKQDFESQFEIELSNSISLCKIDPISNFGLWYENYSDDLVEPNQKFIDIYERGNWRNIDKAAKILDTFTTADIPKWLDSPSEMGKIELEMMYPNSLQCTLPDYRIYTDIGSMAEIPLSRVRLHSGDYSKSAIGVLENNSDREEKVGKNFTHIGNTLLVSAHAQRMGSRNGGWRLTGKEGFSNFLEYLENKWDNLFDEYNDCDEILIKEVVKTPGTDLQFDILGDLVLHKLHMLYIVSFYKATKRSDQ